MVSQRETVRRHEVGVPLFTQKTRRKANSEILGRISETSTDGKPINTHEQRRCMHAADLRRRIPP